LVFGRQQRYPPSQSHRPSRRYMSAPLEQQVGEDLVEVPERPSHEARVALALRDLRRGPAIHRLRAAIHAGRGRSVVSVELAQADALVAVLEMGSCRMGDLADRLRVDSSTVTRTVERLERLDLVRRARSDPPDKRVVIVEPTVAGRAFYRRYTEQTRTSVREILAEFDDDEVEVLAALLERLAGSIEALSREA
jgi:DNA-binding MarR family transcriptional regulator